MEEQAAVINSVTFRHSAELDKIFDALSQAQGEMDGAKKDATNPHFKSKYADLESVMDACRGPFAKHGIAVLQPTSAVGAKVTVTTMLGHKSGQWVASDLEMTAVQATPQGVGSTITYGRRYGLSSMAGIAPEDDDGNAGSVSTVISAPIYQPHRPVSTPSPAKPAPVASAPKPAAKPFNIAEMRAQISAFEKQVGHTNFMRVLGSEGFESVNEISNREAGARVYELLKIAAAVTDKDMVTA